MVLLTTFATASFTIGLMGLALSFAHAQIVCLVRQALAL
jgi:hypothetical protein